MVPRVLIWSKSWPVLEEWLDAQRIAFVSLTQEQFGQFYNGHKARLTLTPGFKRLSPEQFARKHGIETQVDPFPLIWADVKEHRDAYKDEAQVHGATWFQKARANALTREQEYHKVDSKQRQNFQEWWEREQGSKLEPALQSGAIALLDSLWLMEMAASSSSNGAATISRRQNLQPEAFLSLDQIKSCAQYLHPIHIVMVSHMWLQPDHPDPKGTTLQKVAQWCKAKALEGEFPGMKNASDSPRWAVFWDYASLHQHPRTQSESDLFYQGLDSLAILFAHSATVCLQIKDFPSNYPDAYNVPEGANCSPYHQRGWCMLEGGLIQLKDGMQNDDKSSAPSAPENFAERLTQASFTNAKDDKPLVQRLYDDFVEQHFSDLKFMSYAWCGWSNAQVSDLADLIGRGYCPNVTHLNLSDNHFDHHGVSALVDAIVEQDTWPHLVDLNLDRTPIGDAGVEILCLSSNVVRRLTHLYLRKTSIGDRACLALSEALAACENPHSKIQELQMDGNSAMTSKGAEYLCNLPQDCPGLKRLWVPGQLEQTSGGTMLKTCARDTGRRVQIKFVT